MDVQEIIQEMKQMYEDFCALCDDYQAAIEGTQAEEALESPDEEEIEDPEGLDEAQGVDMGIPGPVALDGMEEEQIESKSLNKPYGSMGGHSITINLKVG